MLLLTTDLFLGGFSVDKSEKIHYEMERALIISRLIKKANNRNRPALVLVIIGNRLSLISFAHACLNKRNEDKKDALKKRKKEQKDLFSC